MSFADLNTSDWTFYLLLFLWLVILIVGLRFFHKIEKVFKLKDNFLDGSKTAVGLLTSSLIFGLVIYLILVLAPALGQSKYAKVIFYGFIILLFLVNAFVSFRHYEIRSAIFRLLLLSVLMVVYFYSGWLAGLLMLVLLALAIVVLALFWLKKVLTIR